MQWLLKSSSSSSSRHLYLSFNRQDVTISVTLPSFCCSFPPRHYVMLPHFLHDCLNSSYPSISSITLQNYLWLYTLLESEQFSVNWSLFQRGPHSFNFTLSYVCLLWLQVALTSLQTLQMVHNAVMRKIGNTQRATGRRVLWNSFKTSTLGKFIHKMKQTDGSCSTFDRVNGNATRTAWQGVLSPTSKHLSRQFTAGG
jgi:hypothetical protein